MVRCAAASGGAKLSRNSVLERVEAGQNRRVRRARHGRLRDRLLEQRSLRRQPVHCRCRRTVRAVGADAVRPQRIDGHKEDVAAGGPGPPRQHPPRDHRYAAVGPHRRLRRAPSADTDNGPAGGGGSAVRAGGRAGAHDAPVARVDSDRPLPVPARDSATTSRRRSRRRTTPSPKSSRRPARRRAASSVHSSSTHNRGSAAGSTSSTIPSGRARRTARSSLTTSGEPATWRHWPGNGSRRRARPASRSSPGCTSTTLTRPMPASALCDALRGPSLRGRDCAH